MLAEEGKDEVLDLLVKQVSELKAALRAQIKVTDLRAQLDDAKHYRAEVYTDKRVAMLATALGWQWPVGAEYPTPRAPRAAEDQPPN